MWGAGGGDGGVGKGVPELPEGVAGVAEGRDVGNDAGGGLRR